MKYVEDSTISLATAAPGWLVQTSSSTHAAYPIAAWATVLQTYSEDGAAVTTVEPVFLYDGVLHTSSEWYEAMGEDNRIRVIAP